MMTTRRRNFLRHALTLAAATVALACHDEAQSADESSLVPFDVARVRLVSGTDTTHLRVELASSSQQHTMGLMERHQLADSAGMLFLYPVEQPATAGFWMFRTLIPLDIAFMDSLGQIVAIKQMVPCTATIAEGCTTYPPAVPYRAALEVNAGYFTNHRLTLGSKVILGDTLPLLQHGK